MKAYIAGPITLLMVYRSLKKKSLTPLGTVAATVTAVAHAYHPWNMPFVLLIVFFLAGTRVTRIKKNIKAGLTVSASGSGGEGPRTHIQVFANSLVASILSILHARQIQQRGDDQACLGWPADLLAIGIVANYVSVAADTFSSELGILSRATPRLITSPTLRKVPPGTNGGITLLGVGAGSLGAFILAITAVLSTPKCDGWTFDRSLQMVAAMTAWGTLGSLADSFLGGWLQASVKDVRSGKIVEGEGGSRVLVSTGAQFGPLTGAKATLLHSEGDAAVEDSEPETHSSDEGLRKYDAKNKHRKSSFGDQKPSRVVESGFDLLDNNAVNLLMAALMSVGAMGVASWYWDVPMSTVW
jgi:uncharacterized protein (TIGR00297 family)